MGIFKNKKILIISRDKTAFVKNSNLYSRLKRYSSVTDGLYVVVLSKDINIEGIFDGKLAIYPSRSISKMSYWFSAFYISLFKIERVDLVSSQDPFETGLVAYFISKFLGTKLELQIHTDFLSSRFSGESILNKIRFFIAIFLIPKADIVRVVSDRIRKSLIETKIKFKNIYVMPVQPQIGIGNHDDAEVNNKFSNTCFNILLASRLEKEKNVEIVVRALSRVVKSTINIKLFIVGDGSLKKNLVKMVFDLGLKDVVSFEGWRNDLNSFYKNADLFINVSSYEGFGRTILESAYYGCPILSTDVGVVGEIFTNEDIYILQSLDEEVLANKILDLANNQNDSIKKSENAQKKVGVFLAQNEATFLEVLSNAWNIIPYR